METIITVKDKVVGGAKSAIGALTGNDDWQNEGERQKDQAEECAEIKKEELDAELELSKGKVYENFGAATGNKELENEGKELQERAQKKLDELRQKDGWQPTKDKVAGRAKEAVGAATGKDDLKKEGEYQRERGEATKSQEDYKDSAQQSDAKGALYNMKDKVVGGAKSAVGSMTGNDDLKNEGEKQKDQADSQDSHHKGDWKGTKDNVVGRAKEAAGAATGKDDLKKEGESQRERGEAVKDADSHAESSALETVYAVKDKVVGGAKSAIGALTGNDDWLNEGERQKEQAPDLVDSDTSEQLTRTKDKVVGHAKEAVGAAIGKDDMKKEGQSQRERGEDTNKEPEDDSDSHHQGDWKGTKDNVVGRAKEAVGAATGKDDLKKEGESQRERGEAVKDADSHAESSALETVYAVKDKVVGGAKSAIGALTGNDDWLNEGERQKEQAPDLVDSESSPHKGDLKGTKDTVVGRAKEAVGAATGKDDMKKEGESQRERGDAVRNSDTSAQSSAKETLYSAKDKVVGGAKSAVGAMTGNDDLKNEGERQRDQAPDLVEGDTDSSDQQSSGAMQTLYTVKDKIIGGAKSAIGALTGNDDWQNEGDRQKDQAEDSAEIKREELNANLDLSKGKVYERFGAASGNKDLENEGIELQRQARERLDALNLKEGWQGTKDKIVGRAKEAVGAATGKDDLKKEGQYQRERGEVTK